MDPRDRVEPAHYRLVADASAGDPAPLTPGGRECVRITLVGQSFMVHQVAPCPSPLHPRGLLGVGHAAPWQVLRLTGMLTAHPMGASWTCNRLCGRSAACGLWWVGVLLGVLGGPAAQQHHPSQHAGGVAAKQAAQQCC